MTKYLIALGLVFGLSTLCAADEFLCVQPPIQQTGAWTSAMWNVGEGKQALQLISYVLGETRTGVLRSRDFVCPKTLSFRLAGHSHRNANFARLVDAVDGKMLASLPSPGRDEALPVSWDLTEWQGRSVRMELVDGDAGTSYAWIAICDLQPELVPMPTEAGKLPEGWQELPQTIVQSTVDGVPFIGREILWAPGKEGDWLDVPINGVEAKYLYLKGGSYSPDDQPGWGGSNDRAWHFIGDQMGELQVKYVGGQVDRIPMSFGFTVWWRTPWQRSPEPFVGDTSQAKTMRDSLCVFAPSWSEPWLIRIALRGLPVQSISLVDNADKDGFVLLQGISLAECTKRSAGQELQQGTPSPRLSEWLQTHTVDGAKPLSASRLAAMQKLRLLCETFPSDFTEASVKNTAKITPPAKFIGPRLSFEGPVSALVMGYVYQENSAELLSRIDPDGMVHESGQKADYYNGFGGITPGLAAFYTAAYTRNRAAQLLANAGVLTPANAAISFWDKWLLYFPKAYPELQMGGKPVPGHATVIANQPHVYFDSLRKSGWPTKFKTRDYGNPETDGHGMLMLNRYRVWVKQGRDLQWLRDHWDAVREAAEWIPWVLDNPELSLSEHGLMYNETEGGMLEASIFCDTPCYYGLLASAEMADQIRQRELASRWRMTASRLKRAMELYYPKKIDPWGDVWPPNPGLWGYSHGTMAPLLFAADLYGYDALNQMDPVWQQRAKRTYKMLLTRNLPEWCASGGFGYGQGFVTESALLLDEMDDAANLLEWMAKICYSPRQKYPFRVPEGTSVKKDGSVWRRWGDLGNMFQMNEAVYTCQLLAGVDDTSQDVLKLMPRIPTGWKGVQFSDWPVSVKSGGKVQTVRVSMNISCDADGPNTVTLKASAPVDQVSVRVGPYASQAAADRMAKKMGSEGWSVRQETSGHTKNKPAIWLRLRRRL